jgi:hypothetical protein
MNPTFFIFGAVSVWVASYAIWIAFARIGLRAAMSLPDGTGHVMVHSALDKSMAWFFATAVAIGTLSGIYRWLQMDEDWGVAVVLVLFCTPACWVAFLYVRKQRNRVKLTNAGLTWQRDSMAVFTPWSDVTGFSEALTAWIIRDRNGRMLRIDKLLVGTATTFLDYLKAHVSSHIYELAFANIRPRAALRARLRARLPPRKDSQS